jgi:hypothetical protein
MHLELKDHSLYVQRPPRAAPLSIVPVAMGNIVLGRL